MVLEQLMWSIDYVWCDRVFGIYRNHVWNCDGLVLWTKVCKSHLEPMASHQWLVNTPNLQSQYLPPHYLPRS
jgi:hypothetical protein